jgi:hypothetical protein
MTTTDFDDQNFAAAEAPPGFEFGERDGETVLEPIEASGFPDSAMEPVAGLLWLGYLTDSATLFGHSFVIKTLTRGEKLTVAILTKEWEETLGLADAYQAATVAASLLSVDSQPLVDLDPSADRAAAVGRTFDRVKGWYGPVLDALFERVNDLEQRQIAAFIALQSK